MTRIAIDETCPGCEWPEMGAELKAPVMTCSRCGSAWLTGRGAGLLLAVIQEERELCDPDDVAADYLQDLLDERDAELGVLAELIAGCAVAMIRPGAQSGDPESGEAQR